MADCWFLKQPLCVKWRTELPFKSTPRESSKIYFQGSEWILDLKCSYEVYELTLRTTKAQQPSLKKFSVTTYLQRPGYTPKCIQSSFDSSNFLLWSSSREQILREIPTISNSNKITIICLFHSLEPCVIKTHVSTQTTWTTAPVDLKSLNYKFSTFLNNESLSDVKLKCADRIFSGHRLVLAASSEVFAAMFRNKMAEAEAGVVDIKDMDPEVLDLLLQYMYLGEIPDLYEGTARRLYEAADKYAVHTLRWACSDWMVEYQTVENCLDFLVLADKHSDENFKEEVLSFVAEHLADLSSRSWSTLKEKYPLLVLSVLEKCMEDSLPGAYDGED